MDRTFGIREAADSLRDDAHQRIGRHAWGEKLGHAVAALPGTIAHGIMLRPGLRDQHGFVRKGRHEYNREDPRQCIDHRLRAAFHLAE